MPHQAEDPEHVPWMPDIAPARATQVSLQGVSGQLEIPLGAPLLYARKYYFGDLVPNFSLKYKYRFAPNHLPKLICGWK